MPGSQHAAHVGRHLELVVKQFGHEKASLIAKKCGFEEGPDLVQKCLNREIRDSECATYVHAVEMVLGSSIASFARVNFVLAGCSANRT